MISLLIKLQKTNKQNKTKKQQKKQKKNIDLKDNDKMASSISLMLHLQHTLHSLLSCNFLTLLWLAHYKNLDQEESPTSLSSLDNTGDMGNHSTSETGFSSPSSSVCKTQLIHAVCALIRRKQMGKDEKSIRARKWIRINGLQGFMWYSSSPGFPLSLCLALSLAVAHCCTHCQSQLGHNTFHTTGFGLATRLDIQPAECLSGFCAALAKFLRSMSSQIAFEYQPLNFGFSQSSPKIASVQKSTLQSSGVN